MKDSTLFRRTQDIYGRFIDFWLRYDKARKEYRLSIQPLKGRPSTSGGCNMREYDPMEGSRAVVLKVERRSKANDSQAMRKAAIFELDILKQILGDEDYNKLKTVGIDPECTVSEGEGVK